MMGEDGGLKGRGPSRAGKGEKRRRLAEVGHQAWPTSGVANPEAAAQGDRRRLAHQPRRGGETRPLANKKRQVLTCLERASKRWSSCHRLISMSDLPACQRCLAVHSPQCPQTPLSDKPGLSSGLPDSC